MSHFSKCLALAVVSTLAVAGLCGAQTGALANGSVGAAVSGEATSVALSGGIGYRFNRSLGFGVELTHMPKLKPGFPDGPGIAGIRLNNPNDLRGRATIFTTNVRVEIPTTSRRIIPYAAGGGGVASVTEVFPVYYIQGSSSGLPPSAAPVQQPSSAIYPILPGPTTITTTTTQMALTLGGGVSISVNGHLSVDVDLRALRFMGENSGTIGRFGAGVGYRF